MIIYYLTPLTDWGVDYAASDVSLVAYQRYCLSLGGIYDGWVSTFTLEGQLADTAMCLWWHQYAVAHTSEVIFTESAFPTHLFLHTLFWLLSFFWKHMLTQHMASVFQSLGPSVRVPYNRARKKVLLMLQQELSVWSGCGLAPKKKVAMKCDPHSWQVKSSFDLFWETSSLLAHVPLVSYFLNLVICVYLASQYICRNVIWNNMNNI